jgi:large-conductance mechanosensitive channel
MKFLRKLYDGFIRFGDFIGSIMTFVILTILYLTVVLMVRLVGYLFRKKFVDTSIDSDASTYWQEVDDMESHLDLETIKLPY